MAAAIRLEGYALHAGVATAVTLAQHDGPLTFGRGARRVPLAGLRVQRTDRGVVLGDGDGFAVDLVEHLLGAIGGLGIRRGLLITVEGAEVPILDGGARVFADALGRLEIAAAPPELVVKKLAVLSAGTSEYEFVPSEGTELTVEAVFDHPAIGTQRASWSGDRFSFLESLAPARTFGFAAEANDLWGRGRARLGSRDGERADDEATRAFAQAVVVLDDSRAVALPGAAPLGEGEVARHKLLDLIGDFTFYGGPPQGSVFARRPGHTASHRMISEAISLGILARR